MSASLADDEAQLTLSPQRRIASVVLPDLLCELARARVELESELRGATLLRRKQQPLAVVLLQPGEEVEATSQLDAVNGAARRYGVRPGQTVAEACALLASLFVQEVSREAVEQELGRLAEMALRFGATVALEAPDTLWIDITGSAHLVGGEEALAEELLEQLRGLDYRARVAIAGGPLLAQASARWSGRSVRIVPSQSPAAIAQLPVVALPLEAEQASWLARLGILTWGDLAALPRSAAGSRLGENATRILDLCAGHDSAPLQAYEPPRLITETSSWEDPVDGAQPLVFVLRGLVSRLSQRLQGRGEAAQVVELDVQHDRSIARLRGVEPSATLRFDLASPLWREGELLRVLRSRLERYELLAPSLGLSLRAPVITRALPLQLDLARGASRLGVAGPGRGPEMLPVLLAELMADIGKERVGILEKVDAHRPEAASRLSAPSPQVLAPPKKKPSVPQEGAVKPIEVRAPTRLYAEPLPLSQATFRPGATLAIDRRLYSIERVQFEQRLDGVEWWTDAPTSRDYLRLWLERDGRKGGLEALVYVDRQTGKRYLQAVYD